MRASRRASTRLLRARSTRPSPKAPRSSIRCACARSSARCARAAAAPSRSPRMRLSPRCGALRGRACSPSRPAQALPPRWTNYPPPVPSRRTRPRSPSSPAPASRLRPSSPISCNRSAKEAKPSPSSDRVEPLASVVSLMKADIERREGSMTAQDPFAGFKAVQKEAWSLFTPMKVFTTPSAARLVSFAGVATGQRLLDVGCGTGVAAITAARRGAKVRGLDLSPVLIERAREHAQLANLDLDFAEGDAESLPYGDNEFDVVLSQFGHMFAPRPEVAIGEMLRVLKPGGTIAFSTWPAHLYVGRMFALIGRHLPPPEGVASPVSWGDPNIVAERLAGKVKDVAFDMDSMTPSALSPQHFRRTMETTIGPLIKLIAPYKDEPDRLRSFRSEFEALISEYYDGSNNVMRQQFLMSKANKA